MRTADPSAHGRRPAAIGGGHIVSPRDNLYIYYLWRCAGDTAVLLGETEYQLAASSGSGEMVAAEQVRRVISEQLREVLGADDQNTYVAPAAARSQQGSSSSRPRSVDRIGCDTLTRVLREELRRFRADAAAAAAARGGRPPGSVHGVAAASVDGNRAAGRRADYEEIDDVMSAISERGRVAELGGDGSDDDAPRGPPPPPPGARFDSPSTSSPSTGAGRPAGPPSARAAVQEVDGVGRRPADDPEGVVRLLERIEQSSAELDACFAALVDVGLRCDGDWQRLARQLPIARPSRVERRIALIEARHGGDTRRQAAAALAEWRSHQRDAATLRELVAALRRCDLLEEARFLDSMSQELTS